MANWSIQGSPTRTFADLGLSRLVRTTSNQVIDRVTFEAPGAAVDGSALFAYRSMVQILRDGNPWFSGICLTVPRVGAPADERLTYELAGPWWYLERCIYQQSWKMWNSAKQPAAGLDNLYKSRVILGQDAAGSAITTGEQIEDAILFAISKGAPIALGTVDPDLTLPLDERTDITCADVVAQMLRFSPDCVAYFDYSTSPPTFHCRRQSNMTPVTLAAFGEPVSGLRITPRHDLKIPGVIVRFEVTNQDGDNTFEQCVVQTAGVTTDWETMVATIPLQGYRLTWLTQKIETKDWPDFSGSVDVGLADPVWWRSINPALDEACKDTDKAGGKKAHITNLHITTVGRDNALDLPRYITEGQVQDWMLNAPLSKEVEEETLTVLATYDIVDKDGNHLASKKDVEFTITLLSTDCTSKTYRRLDSNESGESIPAGLADALFASWGKLYWQGELTLTEEECRTILPGSIINLSGGMAEWATMDGIVQQSVEDIDSGITRISFGPPRHLGADDLVELLRGLRTRRLSVHRLARTSGDSRDVESTPKVELSGPGPADNPGKGEGEIVNQTWRKDVDNGGSTYEQAIRADPSDITTTTEDTLIKARQILAFDDSTSSLRLRWVMCSEPTGSNQVTTATVVTDVRYDSSSHKLQMKTRSLTILGSGSESEWTDIAQAEECPST
jgi:hypothetical protein